MTGRPTSLRTRLLLWLVGPLSLIAALEASQTYVTAQSISNRLYDKTLLAVMFTVAENVLASNGDLLSENVLEVLTENLGDQLFYHVAGPDNKFVTGYSGYPRPPADVRLRGGIPVYYDGTHQGDPVRVVAIRQLVSGRDLNGWITVTTWQTVTRRQALSLQLFGQSLVRLAILVCAAGLIAWFAVRTGLKPLDRLQDAVTRRSPSDLAPIGQAVPVEVRRLVDAMNVLFDQLRAAAEARERFIADAAHQLRNPIAALRAQAEVARDARTPEEMRRRIDGIVDSAGRSGRLVNQLLTRARTAAAPADGRVERDVFDLVGITRRTAEEHAPQALKRGHDFSFETCGDRLPVRGNGTLVGEAIANLIDNAIVHNPPGTTVAVAVHHRSCGRAAVVVEDDGTGIPAAARSKVLEPFVSLNSGAAGSGLGLSIVNDIARRHGADLTATPGADGRGSRFELVFTPDATAVRSPA